MTEIPKLDITASLGELERARNLIPGGVLGIRRPYNFVEGEYPVFFREGRGARVIDVDGNEYIDFLCGYGPIIIGQREPEIDEAVIQQIRDRGFCFSLTQEIQNELAETMVGLKPCADMELFVKTGSDATTTAVRLARAYTNRTKVIRCGYHGWHDWCVEVKGGIPAKLYEDILEFEYNRPDQLSDLLEAHGDDTAAVIITPFGHPLAEKMQGPEPGFLAEVKRLAERHGAVLIFDEVRTGFRVSMAGAGEHYGVTPHMAVYGKAMANGYAIAAVCGRRDIMQMGEKEVFISSTFFPNSLSYVAALRTIAMLQRERVLEVIREKGRSYMDKVQTVIDTNGYHERLGVELSGIPPMSFITFARDEQRRHKARRELFYTCLIRRGVFQQPYHHGYICFRHSQDDLDYTVRVIEEALAIVATECP